MNWKELLNAELEYLYRVTEGLFERVDDESLAFEVLEGLSEEELASRELAAPWAPGDTFALGRHLLHSIRHTLQHKGQLFYYLKLQGKPVQTQDLWGM